MNEILRKCIAEGFGTFVLVFFGLGSVHTAVLMDAQTGIWQIAIVWGLAIMLAIFATGAISGAHLNPAVTIALAVWKKHLWALVMPYIVSQMIGGFIAAAILYVLFTGFLSSKEREKGVTRGQPGSVVTAMCYGEFCPNPGSIATAKGAYDADSHNELKKRFSQPAGCLAEMIGTAILACMIFALVDKRNNARPLSNLEPVFIGLTVSMLISVLAPLTQAGFNPARDLGPRIFAYFAGWGSVAFNGTNDLSWLTVYILSPIVGAIVGGGFYEYFLFKDSTETGAT